MLIPHDCSCAKYFDDTLRGDYCESPLFRLSTIAEARSFTRYAFEIYHNLNCDNQQGRKLNSCSIVETELSLS